MTPRSIIKPHFHLTSDVIISIRLKFYEAMLRQGESCASIGRRLGCTRHYINHIISCRRTNISLQKEVCNHLGLKWENVFGPYYHE